MKTPRIQISSTKADWRIRQAPLKQFISRIITRENIPVHQVHVIFVDDEYLRQLHARFLGEDSYTDVMTFNLGEPEAVEGEIYISLDRALEQAGTFGVSVQEEILRLIAHGLLHLAGMEDSTEQQRMLMRQKEDALLEKYAPSSKVVYSPEE